MARDAAKLGEAENSVRLLEGNDVFELYGQWNALAAFTKEGIHLGHVRAHDGDFFPESILDYTEALRSLLKAKRQGIENAAWPLRVDIDVTQTCNADCSFCFSRPYQNVGYRGHRAPKDTLEALIAELSARGTKTIRYCGGGDPLVHPEVGALLALPDRYGMRSCVITNADFLNAELAGVIFDHVDHLRWSVNAAKDDTRLKIHRPARGANPLSVTMEAIRKLVSRRNAERPGRRRPMVWATYMLIPENVNEIVEAADRLREIGVDSVSFRPVHHGLTSPWDNRLLAKLGDSLDVVASMNESPKFSVFVPRRRTAESTAARPSGYFQYCHSRTVRTVLEATADGLSLQSCGMYRGTGTHGTMVLRQGQRFSQVWQNASGLPHPLEAPRDCSSCIDISMNQTLEFIWNVLHRDSDATFSRAWVEAVGTAAG